MAGGQRKLAVARDLGAEICIDYGQLEWPATVRSRVGAVDVVYDGVGGQTGRDAFELLAQSGRYAGFGMPSGAFAAITATARPDVAG